MHTFLPLDCLNGETQHFRLSRSQIQTAHFLAGPHYILNNIYTVFRFVVISSNVEEGSPCSWPLRMPRGATVEFPCADEFGWDPVSPILEQPSEDKGAVLGFVHHFLPVPVWRMWSDPAELSEIKTLHVHLLSTLPGYIQAVCKSSCLLYLSHWLVSQDYLEEKTVLIITL